MISGDLIKTFWKRCSTPVTGSQSHFHICTAGRIYIEPGDHPEIELILPICTKFHRTHLRNPEHLSHRSRRRCKHLRRVKVRAKMPITPSMSAACIPTYLICISYLSGPPPEPNVSPYNIIMPRLCIQSLVQSTTSDLLVKRLTVFYSLRFTAGISRH